MSFKNKIFNFSPFFFSLTASWSNRRKIKEQNRIKLQNGQLIINNILSLNPNEKEEL